MMTAAQYRQYAEECLEAMRAATIPEVRTALSTAAQRWMTLADQLEEEETLLGPAHDRGSRTNGADAPAALSSS
jgi:hypothetical protein